MAKKLKSFTVYGRVVMDVGISIRAASFEDALRESGSLKPHDFAKPLGEYIDSAVKVTSVCADNDNASCEDALP